MKKSVFLCLMSVLLCVFFSCSKEKKENKKSEYVEETAEVIKIKKVEQSAAEKKYKGKISQVEYEEEAVKLDDVKVDLFDFDTAEFEYVE